MVAAIVGDLADVVPATTLDEAYRQLRQRRFDLIILDLELPDGTGLALLHHLGEAAAMPAPVVIFSVREISCATVPNVAASLVKSQTSNQELLETVMALIWRPESPNHGEER